MAFRNSNRLDAHEKPGLHRAARTALPSRPLVLLAGCATPPPAGRRPAAPRGAARRRRAAAAAGRRPTATSSGRTASTASCSAAPGFADAHYGHAYTRHGGRATPRYSPGAYPQRTGIIGNEWRDPATGELGLLHGRSGHRYLGHATAPLAGTSPRNLRARVARRRAAARRRALEGDRHLRQGPRRHPARRPRRAPPTSTWPRRDSSPRRPTT